MGLIRSREDEVRRLKSLHNELADKTSLADNLTKRLAALSTDHSDSKQYVKQLESEVAKAAELLKQYKQEAESKTREVQHLKDEMLVQEIHMNMAEKKAQKLEAENASLVDRWMQRAADEAEKMNDANAFLKRYGLF